MNLTKITLGVVSAAVLAGAAPVAQADTLFVPSMVYRTGPYAPNGIPFANGFKDYLTMLNERDGGIGGLKIEIEECETGYNTKVGVECYEKLKGKNALVFLPLSTGITYQLIPKTFVDHIPVLSSGYGRTSAADGRVFPYVFNFPSTYWSQASAVIKYIGDKEGGMDKLKGKKIAHVYHNSAYGKEANPTLETLAEKYGYELTLLAVDHPGQEQKATWLQIRRLRPDWIFMSGWGVMNQVAIKEAAAIGYPMDHFIGNWWAGTESDTVPGGAGSDKYTSTTFHSPGAGFAVHDEIKKHVYGKDMGAGEEARIGEVLYNRGLINAVFVAEAIRNAQKISGKANITGVEMRDGLEAMNLTQDRLKELGLEGFMGDIKITCEDHEGGGQVRVQQWSAADKAWTFASDWYTPMSDVIRPMVEADAKMFAEENKIEPRSCN